MSEAARQHLLAIASQYQRDGFPNPKTWLFDAGARSVIQQELEHEGMIEKLFGVPGGFTWRLTSAGAARARELCAD